MVKIDRIVLKGFKSIKELDLELKDLNVLIGSNGSGKSNFIDFFKMMAYLGEGRLERFFDSNRGMTNVLHYGPKKTSAIDVTCYLDGSEYQINIPFEAYHYYVLRELADKLPILKKLLPYHFNDTSSMAKVKDSCDIHDNRYLKPDAANLASMLYLFFTKYKQHYAKIVSTIQLVYPDFDTFILEPDRLNERNIQIRWRDKNEDNEFFAYSLSDGTLRFICLATLLLQPELPYFVIIDEPELGLHPAAISVLASLIKRASSKTQVIVATQSVNLIDHFIVDNIIVADRRNNASCFKRLSHLDYDEWLKDYSLSELWEKNILGGRP